MKKHSLHPLRKYTSIGRICIQFFLALILFSAITVCIFVPKPVFAVPTEEIASLPNATDNILKKIGDGLVTAGKVGIKNAIRTFLEKLAYDTAVWIGSGDVFQKPLLYTEEVGPYFQNMGDAAAGSFLNTLASENGFVKLNLCSLPSVQALRFKLILPKVTGKSPYTPSCKLSDINKSLYKYGNDIRDKSLAFIDDPKSLVKFSATFDEGENALSSMLTAMDQTIGAQTAAQREAEINRLKSDAKPKTGKVSGYIETPAGVVEAQLQGTIAKSTDAETIQQDNIVADALSVFAHTLAQKSLQTLMSGIMNFMTESDINASIAGLSSVTSSSGGIQGVKERFASFKTPSFKKGSEVDILTNFANCPTEGVDTINCVVDEGMRSAIDEELSLQEAVRTGRISGDAQFGSDDNSNLTTNITYRNIKILKQYSVVPVGWVLAAEYTRNFGGQKTVSLQDVMNAYDQCNETNYSPYCGLVDPDWTLKAPDVLCKTEGYGSTVIQRNFEDLDGNVYSP